MDQNGAHHEGYVIKNIRLHGLGKDANGKQLAKGNGIQMTEVDHVSIDNMEITGFWTAVGMTDGDYISLTNSDILYNRKQGFLGSGDYVRVENNYFEGNGENPVDHNIYLSGGGDADPDAAVGMRIRNNTLTRTTTPRTMSFRPRIQQFQSRSLYWQQASSRP